MARDMANQIVIVGFMGAGKTTVANEVANRLGVLAVDLDDRITRDHGRSPAQLIEHQTEPEFREIENATLRKVLAEDHAQVVALGGGAWTIAENRKLIAEHRAFTVWLDAPFELCWKRIEKGNETRPLAPTREAAEALYYKRCPVYELADMRITIAELDNAKDIAIKILDRRSQALRKKNS